MAARTQARVARLLARLLMALVLIAGISAMHTLLDAPMAHAMPATQTTMQPSGPEIGADASVASPANRIADSAVAPSLITSMNDAAMHACLFLVMAAALLLVFLPVAGDRMPRRALLVALRRWLNTAVSGNDRTLALQVLRI